MVKANLLKVQRKIFQLGIDQRSGMDKREKSLVHYSLHAETFISSFIPLCVYCIHKNIQYL